MKHIFRRGAFLFAFIIVASLSVTTYAAEPVVEDEQSEQNLIAAAQAMRESGRVQFNFKDLEMIQFIRFMSELLGENILVDPAVKGTVSVVSPKVISIKEARQVMLSVLEMNGLSLQGMEGYSKLSPANKGPSTTNEVIKGPQSIAPSEQVAVQIVPLEYVKAAYVVEPVKLGVPGLNIAPLAGGSGVLLTGRSVLLNNAVRIIRALDAPDSIRTIKTFTLKHTSAKLVEGHLNAIAQDPTSKLASLFSIGDERSSKINVVGSREALVEAEKVILELDIQSSVNNFHVYRLQNADAQTVSEQISQILAVAAKLQPDPNNASAQSSVVPDLSTNSLVFTASQEQYNAIRGILEELDVQPKQVLLRGLIAEVNLNKLNSAGVDWAAWGGDAGDNLLIGGGAQLGATGIPAQFQQWFADMTKQEEIVYDANGNAIKQTSTKGMGLLYAYIKMLNTFNAINILSMPRLMCTDNMPSALQVGHVIPLMKGQTSDISNPAATQSSYEYKDTGLILKVTPHIRSGNLVALDIEQTVEDLVSATGNTTPTTSKRLIKTNVLVANNETIILGGLIREVERTLKNRVPGFSYIPLLGNLFTSQERTREKIDLMVFLTPTIIETPQQAREATISVTTGESGLSIGERQTIIKNYEEFLKSNAKEGVAKDNLLANTASEDQKPKKKEPGLPDRSRNRDEK
ncbi:type II secretion system secretin GspD [Synergistaceae bacterium OttesenSCG-928-I11]|nr:type II secretion system secretin GspD [Synergistaceae bacterium OttesenSCG-928-I11]